MYTDFFGFTRRPFELLPEPGFLYLTPQHAKAIANIKFALMNRDSFVIISGEVGIGKTTILNQITSELPESFALARLTHTTLSPVELIQAILSAFGIPSYKNKRVFLLDRLRNFLIELGEQDRYAVIMVDEAQNLRLDTLEELRLLSCIDGDDKKLLSNVLVGQPSLNKLLDHDKLANLRDRTRLRQHLPALDAQSTIDYICHRLDVVGGDFDKVFDKDVADIIFAASAGIPRRINTICDTALTAACVDGKKRVSREIVEVTLEELNIDYDSDDSDSKTAILQIESPTLSSIQEVAPPARTTTGADHLKSAGGSEPWVVVYHEGRFLEVITVDQLPFLVGRDTTNSYAMNCVSVSRRHAVIFYTDGDFVIEDLTSTNGTQVNNEVGRRHLLTPGDVVSIGLFELVFCPAEFPVEGSAPKLGQP